MSDDPTSGMFDVLVTGGGVAGLSGALTLARARRSGHVLAGPGLVVAPHPMGVGTRVPTGPTGATDVPGAWAAGNVTDLAEAATDEAVALRGAASSTAAFGSAIEARVSERVLGERRHGLGRLVPGAE